MSTKGHNTRVGKVAIATGISMAVVGVCHFGGAKFEESRIIPREQYINIENIYNLAAKDESCFPKISNFGTGSPAQEARDRRCIGGQIPQENLDAIGDYNQYHGSLAQTGRLSKNVVALGLIGGGVIVAGIIGLGYRRG
jgi:hypothetical protein